jgi:hypothetical protein
MQGLSLHAVHSQTLCTRKFAVPVLEPRGCSAERTVLSWKLAVNT